MTEEEENEEKIMNHSFEPGRMTMIDKRGRLERGLVCGKKYEFDFGYILLEVAEGLAC